MTTENHEEFEMRCKGNESLVSFARFLNGKCIDLRLVKRVYREDGLFDEIEVL